MRREKTGGFDRKRLEELIEEAIVDAYGEEEQAGGFFSAIEENLSLPFATAILGVPVTVVEIGQDDRSRIFAVCERDGKRQRIALTELPLPSPPPEGAEWIAAYRYWARHGGSDDDEEETS